MLSKSAAAGEKVFLIASALLSVLCCSAAFYLDEMALMAIPFGLAVGIWCLIDIRQVFYFLLFLLPVSSEYYFSNGFATDLPTEPLMVMLMIATIIYFAWKPQTIKADFFRNPIIWFILIHFVWIIISSINSIHVFYSIKYALAKSWYLIVFVFLAGAILHDIQNIRRIFWSIYTPLVIIVIICIVRYAMLGFVFEYVNEPLQPFFRNKVNYATMLSLFFPLLFVAAGWYPKDSWKHRFIQFGKLVFFVGIYFSYTRAAYLALIAAAVFILITRWKMTRAVLITTAIVVLMLAYYLVHDSTYLNYSPEFRKTVHHSYWADHLLSTFQGEDASSMERVHMWIGGIWMSTEHPIMGSGPNTFYPEYKRYTVSRFETYLSDNEGHLTIHNYFLLLMVEQGIIGLLIWCALIVSFFLIGERTYHRLLDPGLKRLCMASICIHVVMMVSLTLSDLVEVDKTGSIFFINLALMVNLWMISRKESGELNNSKTEISE